MGNENERKHDPAENRENRMGHRFDDSKTGGEERNVGLTGDQGGSGGGGSVGSGGIVGGSAEFLSGEQSRQGESAPRSGQSDRNLGSEASQVLTGEQDGDDNFGGRTGSGTSAMAANNSRADLGASGAGAPDSRNADERPAIGLGGQSEIGGASDLGGGETGLGSGQQAEDYQERDGNPEEGFAEGGQGAEKGSRPGGIEGSGERQANRGSDIEGGNSSR